VTIKVELGLSMVFTTYKDGVFEINPGQRNTGEFRVIVRLTDDNPDPKTSFYSFYIIVPTIEVEEEKQQASGGLTAKIESVSKSGVLVIRFSEDILSPANFTMIDESVLKLSITSDWGRAASQIKFDWEVVAW